MVALHGDRVQHRHEQMRRWQQVLISVQGVTGKNNYKTVEEKSPVFALPVNQWYRSIEGSGTAFDFKRQVWLS